MGKVTGSCYFFVFGRWELVEYEIDNETWLPWTDIQKKYGNKLTRQQLYIAAENGLVRTRELQVDDTPYMYTVYAEADIVVGLAYNKFKVEVKTEQWFQ
jgi:hypothetical protein